MRIVLGLFVCCLFLFACGEPKKGALSPETRSELDALVDNYHIEPGEKYHRLARRMGQLLNEAYAKRTDEGMMDHLREFNQENETALRILREELQTWLRNLPDNERAKFIIRVNAEDYAEDLRKRRKQFLYRVRNSPDYKREFLTLFGILDLHR